MLKLHEIIPPFSSIEVLIHGRRADTLVKTAQSCSLQASSKPSLLLTIPTRKWAPFLFTVSGPPLSPCVWIKVTIWFDESPCTVLLQHLPHTQSGFRQQVLSGSSSLYRCCFPRWELQFHAACLWTFVLLQCFPSLGFKQDETSSQGKLYSPQTWPSWSIKLSLMLGRQAGLKTDRSTLSSVHWLIYETDQQQCFYQVAGVQCHSRCL